jgi:hypothetical protein
MQGKGPEIPAVKNLYVPVNDKLLQLSYLAVGAEEQQPETIPLAHGGYFLDLTDFLVPVPIPEDESPEHLKVKPSAEEMIQILMKKTQVYSRLIGRPPPHSWKS